MYLISSGVLSVNSTYHKPCVVTVNRDVTINTLRQRQRGLWKRHIAVSLNEIFELTILALNPVDMILSPVAVSVYIPIKLIINNGYIDWVHDNTGW